MNTSYGVIQRRKDLLLKLKKQIADGGYETVPDPKSSSRTEQSAAICSPPRNEHGYEQVIFFTFRNSTIYASFSTYDVYYVLCVNCCRFTP